MPSGLGDAILADLVEQGFVADLQNGGCLLAIPIGLFQGASDGEGFRFIFRRAPEGLQTSSITRPGRLARGSSVAIVAGQKLGDGQALISQNQLALQEIIQLAQIAGPGMIVAGLQQIR